MLLFRKKQHYFFVLVLALAFSIFVWYPTNVVSASACNVPNGYATIQDAIADVTCVEIEIESGHYNEIGTLNLDRDIVLRGVGVMPTITNFQGNGIINIGNDIDVTVENLNIYDGYSGLFGGGISVGRNSELTARNAHFTANIAAGFGAALSLRESSAILENVYFAHNHTINSDATGGAISLFEGSTLTATDVNFNGNESEAGGAIYIDESCNKVTLTRVTFMNNSAENGGAIHNAAEVCGGPAVVLTEVTLIANEATDKGGGILNTGNLSFNSGYASGNSAENGGAIYADGGSFAITSSGFDGNSATLSGGGLYVANGGPNIGNSSFTNNSADFGGAIYNANQAALYASSTWFEGNHADFDGGAIYHSGNDANTGSGLVLSNVNIVRNTATNGGGIYYRFNPHSILFSVVFDGNIAEFSGGGLYAAETNADLEINTATFVNNQAKNGAGMTALHGKFILDGIDIRHNISERTGGGIYASGAFSMTNAYVGMNQASNGGGIYYTQSVDQNGELRLDLSRFAVEYNEASNNGGGIYITNPIPSKLVLGSVTNNEATNDGGGIYNTGITVIENMLVGENSASNNGGGIWNIGYPFNINHSAVYHNTAANSGGGIYAPSGLTTLVASTLSGNHANIEGSAISSNYFLMDYVTIAYNSGIEAIFAEENSISSSRIRYSIIAHNPDGNCASTGYLPTLENVIDDDGTCSTTRSALTFVDPLLGPLENNGGNTLTHALLPGSPAIDAGEQTCADPDQRLMSRLNQDGNNNPSDGNQCDLGAYEVMNQVPSAVSLASANTTNSGSGVLWLGMVLLMLVATSIGVRIAPSNR